MLSGLYAVEPPLYSLFHLKTHVDELARKYPEYREPWFPIGSIQGLLSPGLSAIHTKILQIVVHGGGALLHSLPEAIKHHPTEACMAAYALSFLVVEPILHQTGMLTLAMPILLCAQHGRTLTGESPVVS